MKRILALLAIGLLLTGCGDQKAQESAGGGQGEEKLNEEHQDNQNKEGAEKELEEADNEPEIPEVVEPQYRLNPNTWAIEPIDGANEKVVLLTIDDAPDKYGLEMAKTLKELGVNAIFFVNGHFINTEEKQAILKEIHDMGFIIGNHTYNHQKLNDVSNEKQKEEIVKLNDLVEEITGERPNFFRAPHGVNTDFSKQVAKEEGMLLMNWTYGYDYFKPYMEPKKLTEAMVTGKGPEVDVPYSLLRPGANLLMHDREWTSAALADIVKGFQDQGYEIVDPSLIETP